jgi:hypothetical protein
VDASDRPDVAELFRLQATIPSGDVEVQWGQARFLNPGVSLMLTFRRPARVIVFIELDRVSRAGIVDLILAAQGLYLQLGHPGDRVMTTMDAARILIRVPEAGFGPTWETILRDHLTRHFRALGKDTKKARQAAEGFVVEWRSISGLRMKGLPSSPPDRNEMGLGLPLAR